MILESKQLQLVGEKDEFDILLHRNTVGKLSYHEQKLHCFIAEKFRRQYIALEACSAFLDHLEDEGAEFVTAEIYIENSAAMGLLNKLGFELKSIHNETMIYHLYL